MRTYRRTVVSQLDQPPRRIEWVGENRAVHAHDVIEVSPCSASTRVEYLSSYDYRLAPAVLDRVMALPINRLCDDAQRGLATALAR